jgi:hypothetical protein
MPVEMFCLSAVKLPPTVHPVRHRHCPRPAGAGSSASGPAPTASQSAARCPARPRPSSPTGSPNCTATWTPAPGRAGQPTRAPGRRGLAGARPARPIRQDHPQEQGCARADPGRGRHPPAQGADLCRRRRRAGPHSRVLQRQVPGNHPDRDRTSVLISQGHSPKYGLAGALQGTSPAMTDRDIRTPTPKPQAEGQRLTRAPLSTAATTPLRGSERASQELRRV